MKPLLKVYRNDKIVGYVDKIEDIGDGQKITVVIEDKKMCEEIIGETNEKLSLGYKGENKKPPKKELSLREELLADINKEPTNKAVRTIDTRKTAYGVRKCNGG